MAATAAYLVLKGHTFEYFMNLSMIEKLMCKVAMDKERQDKLDMIKIAIGGVFGGG